MAPVGQRELLSLLESQNSQKNDSEWVLLLRSITSKNKQKSREARLLKMVKDKKPKGSKEIPKMETEAEHPSADRPASALGTGLSQALADLPDTLGTGPHTSFHRRRVATTSTLIDDEKGESDQETEYFGPISRTRFSENPTPSSPLKGH